MFRLPSGARWLGLAAALSLLLLAIPAEARPVIVHNPPRAKGHEPLVFEAHITSAGGILESYLCYRVDAGEYKVVPLTLKTPPETFGVELPTEDLKGDTLRYFLVAYDASDLSAGYWHSRESAEPVLLPLPPKPVVADGGVDGGGANDVIKTAADEVPEEEKKRPPDHPPAAFDGAIPAPGALPVGSGFLRIVSEPSGAIIKLNGETIGSAPVERAVKPGTYLLAATLFGYSDISRLITVASGKGRQVLMHFKPKVIQIK